MGCKFGIFIKSTNTIRSWALTMWDVNGIIKPLKSIFTPCWALTMWDVNMREFDTKVIINGLSINYVGCK